MGGNQIRVCGCVCMCVYEREIKQLSVIHAFFAAISSSNIKFHSAGAQEQCLKICMVKE